MYFPDSVDFQYLKHRVSALLVMSICLFFNKRPAPTPSRTCGSGNQAVAPRSWTSRDMERECEKEVWFGENGRMRRCRWSRVTAHSRCAQGASLQVSMYIRVDLVASRTLFRVSPFNIETACIGRFAATTLHKRWSQQGIKHAVQPVSQDRLLLIIFSRLVRLSIFQLVSAPSYPDLSP